MKKTAFTLIEVLIAVVILGFTIASLVGASVLFLKTCNQTANLSTAEFLTEQIRELTIQLPTVDPQSQTAYFGAESGESLATYDDVDDFDNKTFNPPIAADRSPISDLALYTQVITVENVSSSDFSQVAGDHASPFYRVTVKILFNSEEISSVSWIRARY